MIKTCNRSEYPPTLHIQRNKLFMLIPFVYKHSKNTYMHVVIYVEMLMNTANILSNDVM